MVFEIPVTSHVVAVVLEAWRHARERDLARLAAAAQGQLDRGSDFAPDGRYQIAQLLSLDRLSVHRDDLVARFDAGEMSWAVRGDATDHQLSGRTHRVGADRRDYADNPNLVLVFLLRDWRRAARLLCNHWGRTSHCEKNQSEADPIAHRIAAFCSFHMAISLFVLARSLSQASRIAKSAATGSWGIRHRFRSGKLAQGHGFASSSARSTSIIK
jgi:hypothetical protein